VRRLLFKQNAHLFDMPILAEVLLNKLGRY